MSKREISRLCILYIIHNPTVWFALTIAFADYILYVNAMNERFSIKLPKRRALGSTEMIADALRSAICAGEIAPDAPLKQDEIAAEFGISPTPVREALKLLVSEGLAVLHHNRGCFVTSLSVEVARELTEFRALLEPRLARWALDRLNDEDIRLASRIIAEIDATPLPATRLRLATEFHTAIYRRADRPFFLDQVNRARNNLSRYWLLAWSGRRFPENTQAEHRRVLDLCVARDREGLATFIERHIVASGELVLEYLKTTQ
jgi:DNA-binding GntR family transcriptional regulator